jgi:MFS family permease
VRRIYLAAFLQNVALWVPIEKLFMTDIGFDNGSVAVMAAAYAAVVPLLEVPSGILADRWSRRGVALLAQSALIVSVVIGGLSPNVGVYIVAALFLGVFFAMQSGTFESIAYDTALEETGDSTVFERTIGRVRFVESAGLVMSALVGGLLAEVVPLRATYFMTAPFIVLGAVAVLRFREPRLHRAEDAQPLRPQIADPTGHGRRHRRDDRRLLCRPDDEPRHRDRRPGPDPARAAGRGPEHPPHR